MKKNTHIYTWLPTNINVNNLHTSTHIARIPRLHQIISRPGRIVTKTFYSIMADNLIQPPSHLAGSSKRVATQGGLQDAKQDGDVTPPRRNKKQKCPSPRLGGGHPEGRTDGADEVGDDHHDAIIIDSRNRQGLQDVAEFGCIECPWPSDDPSLIMHGDSTEYGCHDAPWPSDDPSLLMDTDEVIFSPESGACDDDIGWWQPQYASSDGDTRVVNMDPASADPNSPAFGLHRAIGDENKETNRLQRQGRRISKGSESDMKQQAYSMTTVQGRTGTPGNCHMRCALMMRCCPNNMDTTALSCYLG